MVCRLEHRRRRTKHVVLLRAGLPQSLGNTRCMALRCAAHSWLTERRYDIGNASTTGSVSKVSPMRPKRSRGRTL